MWVIATFVLISSNMLAGLFSIDFAGVVFMVAGNIWPDLAVARFGLHLHLACLYNLADS